MSAAVTQEIGNTLDEFDNDGLEDVFDGIARKHISGVCRNVPPHRPVGRRATWSKRFGVGRSVRGPEHPTLSPRQAKNPGPVTVTQPDHPPCPS